MKKPRLTLIVSALSAVTALAITWGTTIAVAGIALSAPIVALIVFVLTVMVVQLWLAASQAIKRARERRTAEAAALTDPEVEVLDPEMEKAVTTIIDENRRREQGGPSPATA